MDISLGRLLAVGGALAALVLAVIGAAVVAGHLRMLWWRRKHGGRL